MSTTIRAKKERRAESSSDQKGEAAAASKGRLENKEYVKQMNWLWNMTAKNTDKYSHCLVNHKGQEDEEVKQNHHLHRNRELWHSFLDSVS